MSKAISFPFLRVRSLKVEVFSFFEIEVPLRYHRLLRQITESPRTRSNRPPEQQPARSTHPLPIAHHRGYISFRKHRRITFLCFLRFQSFYLDRFLGNISISFTLFVNLSLFLITIILFYLFSWDFLII